MDRPLTILKLSLAILILLPVTALSSSSPSEPQREVSRLSRWWDAVQAGLHLGGLPAAQQSATSPAAGMTAASDWHTTSNQTSYTLGWSVAGAGDVNADGYDDVIVGVPRYSNGQSEEGAALLFLGGEYGPDAYPAWVGEGDQQWAWFGYAIAAAGDVNADGFDDIIVGAPRYDGEETDEGAAFIYYGGPSGIVTDTTWIVHPTDQANARFGIAVSTAGLVNSDVYSDVIVTANGYDGEEINEGAAFIFHGAATGPATTTGWIVHPTDQAYADFGRSAAAAGDVNGDGFSDVIIGAPWYDTDQTDEGRDRGRAYVYYGSTTGAVTTTTWVVTGERREAEFGIAVSAAGNVDGDAYDDVVIGAYKYTEELWVTPWREGAFFVYRGGSGGLGTSPAVTVLGGQEQDKFGLSVSAGDVNSDGYSDVIVGAPNYASGEEQKHEGAAFVYQGSPGGVATSAAWSAEGDQVGAAFGFCVAAAGDVNADGYGDILVGAPTYQDNVVTFDEGGAFLTFGDE